MSSNIRITRVCDRCSQDFVARTTVTKYCSHRCSRAAYKAKLTAKKVGKSDVETRAIRVGNFDQINGKDFLTVRDVSTLLNCSKRTMYRLISNGTIPAVTLSERKTIVRRSDLEKLFDHQISTTSKQQSMVVEVPQFKVSDCYTLTEVQRIYGISDKALYELIIRNGIPKIKQGWYSYVPKILIDKILHRRLTPPIHESISTK